MTVTQRQCAQVLRHLPTQGAAKADSTIWQAAETFLKAVLELELEIIEMMVL